MEQIGITILLKSLHFCVYVNIITIVYTWILFICTGSILSNPLPSPPTLHHRQHSQLQPKIHNQKTKSISISDCVHMYNTNIIYARVHLKKYLHFRTCTQVQLRCPLYTCTPHIQVYNLKPVYTCSPTNLRIMLSI